MLVYAHVFMCLLAHCRVLVCVCVCVCAGRRLGTAAEAAAGISSASGDTVCVYVCVYVCVR
jgi:hypothetical protein